MTEIDETTGLPTLPKDHFWRVDKTSWTTSRNHGYQSYARVSIIKKMERKVFLPREFFGIQFGYHKDPITNHHSEVVDSQVVWDGSSGALSDADLENLDQAVHVRGVWYRPLYPGSLTPAHILQAAEYCLERLREKEMTERLYGDYPPNKLKVKDNTEFLKEKK